MRLVTVAITTTLLCGGCKWAPLSGQLPDSYWCNQGNAQAPVGDYSLKYYVDHGMQIDSPAATGALHMTATTYQMNITYPVAPPTVYLADSGSYTFTPGACITMQSQAGRLEFEGTANLFGPLGGPNTLWLTSKDQLVSSQWTQQ